MSQAVSSVRFTNLIDLASESLGGRALECSDDFFASMHNLVKAAPAVFDPDAYTDRGKLMDGWESRRKRVPWPRNRRRYPWRGSARWHAA